MFDRFTEHARKAMSNARQEALGFHHDYIGTEHMLLGVVAVEDGVGARVLRDLGVGPRSIRTNMAKIVRNGARPVPQMGQLPFTPRSKRVRELSLEEAQSLGHRHIGTEHLLLGLIQEDSGMAAQVLERLGVTVDLARAQVVELVPAGPTAKPAQTERDDARRRDGNRRIFAVSGDGSRTEVEGDGLVVAFSDGREIVVSFMTPHYGRRGLTLRSEFHTPGTAPPPRVPTGVPDVVASLVLHPGAGNLMRVAVEARRHGDGADVLAEGAPPPTRAFWATKGDARTPVDAATLVMDFGDGRDIAVGDADMPDRPGFVALFTSSHIWVGLGACNVVHVAVA